MSCRPEGYKDLEKWKRTVYKQKTRYYGKYRQPARRWEKWQDELVLEHSMPDRELARIVHHGVNAIQVRRSKLKKGEV